MARLEVLRVTKQVTFITYVQDFIFFCDTYAQKWSNLEFFGGVFFGQGLGGGGVRLELPKSQLHEIVLLVNEIFLAVLMNRRGLRTNARRDDLLAQICSRFENSQAPPNIAALAFTFISASDLFVSFFFTFN